MAGAAEHDARCAKTALELREYIAAELLDQPLDGDPLAAGVVDSLGIEQLVQHIEEAFGVKVGDEEMIWDNFASLAALAAFVETERDARAR